MEKNVNAGQLPRGGTALVSGCGHPGQGTSAGSSCFGKEAKFPAIHSLAWLPPGSLWVNFKCSVLLQVVEASAWPKSNLGTYLFIYLSIVWLVLSWISLHCPEG